MCEKTETLCPRPSPNIRSPLRSFPTQAKEMLQASLPVHEEVQRIHIDAISQLVLRNKNKRAMERNAIREQHRFRAEPHPSQAKVK